MTQDFDVRNCNLEGVTVVEAGAGTGKTYNIAEIYLRLLLEGHVDSLEQILVVTFTDAALIAHLHTSGADCGCCHIVRLYDLQPGIRQAAGYGTCDCFQNAHILTSDFIVLGSTLHAAW